MSINMPAALDHEAAPAASEARAVSTGWVDTMLAVLFAASAVLFVSFVAAVTGLV